MLSVSINFGSESNQESSFLEVTAVQASSVRTQTIVGSQTFFPAARLAAEYNWGYSHGFSTIACAGNTYLGHYGAGAQVVSPKFTVTEHQGVIVTFKLALIDSWDGESFKILADGKEVYTLAHVCPSGHGQGTNTCVRRDTNWNDVYKTITFGFNHAASTLSFVLTSTLDQERNDESWGVADFTVTLSKVQVTPEGRPIMTLDEKPTIFFSCAGSTADQLWTYNHGFSTIKCAGNTYVGHYGAGAQVSSFAFNLRAHQAIVVSFKLALIDSWDGESFKILADGKEVHALAHVCPSGHGQGTNTCVRTDANWNDVYKTITFGFNHTASTVSFVLTSSLDQEKNDESWGVCDFTVTVSPKYQVTAAGEYITQETLTTDRTSTFIPCSGSTSNALWSYNHGFNLVKCNNGNNYLAYGHGGVVTTSNYKVGAHQGLIVSFKLAWIDSWDGETFTIKTDKDVVFHRAYGHGSSPSNTCQNGWNDAFEVITVGLNHTADTVSFTFSSTLDQAKEDEAWGVCDFSVTATPSQVASTGRRIQTVSDKPTTWFSCAGPVADAQWTYNHGFNTIKCSGNTYIGNYGAGASVNSFAFVAGEHVAIIISYKLGFIDSWDNEFFKVFADGVLVSSATHHVYSSTSNVCATGWNDAFTVVKAGFNHTASTVSFVLTSSLDQGRDDESWGVCDFTVTLSPKYQVKADGSFITFETVTDKSTWLPCSNPTSNLLWAYTQGFKTIKCNNGNNYLAYGKAGSVSSGKITLAEHQAVIVSFKLAFIDSWDGETFTVTADGKQIHSVAYNQASSHSNTCQNGWNDAYATVTVGFNHTAADVTFAFTSTLDQESADEAWGICDFTVTLSPRYQVFADGTFVTTEYITEKASWFSCSAPANNLLWTYSKGFSTVKCTTATYLGPYGAGAVVTSPKFKVNGAHQGIVVSFKLAFIDSWDDESFNLHADGALIYTASHNVHKATTNTCHTAWNDAYATVTVGFNHTGPEVTFALSSTLNQANDDESWGVCDFAVRISPKYQVTATGDEITNDILTGTSTWYACSNPASSLLWSYSAGFNTIKCNGHAYLGPYGQGASVSSGKILIKAAHQGMIVSFRLAFIDSWDGESFQIFVDGAKTPAFAVAYGHGSSKSNTCQNGWNDAYTTAQFGLNHTADSVTFTFTSTLDQGKDDEAWGVCDFTVQLTQVQVAASGRLIKTIGEKPISFFPCGACVKDEEWTYSQGFNTIKCGTTTYLAYGQDGVVSSPGFSVGPHKAIVGTFKLAFIDSWDGESFQIFADDAKVPAYTVAYNHVSSTKNTCQNGWNDEFVTVTFGFNHTADAVYLRFSSTLNQAKEDEAWGVCDFSLRTSPVQVAASGRPIVTIDDKGTTFFSCSNQVADEQWQYSSGFSTITCGKTTYVAYGKGGVATSFAFAAGAHKGVTVSFKLAFIDSWDGETFRVTADGTEVYKIAYSQNSSPSNNCQNGWNDGYKDVAFSFNHEADAIVFSFSSTLDQEKADEAWGVCDFNVKTTAAPAVVVKVFKPIDFVSETLTGKTLMTWYKNQDPSGIISSFIDSGYKCVIRNANFNGTSVTNGKIRATIDMFAYTADSVEPVWDSGLVVEVGVTGTTVASVTFVNEPLVDKAELKYFVNAWANNAAIPFLATKA